MKRHFAIPLAAIGVSAIAFSPAFAQNTIIIEQGPPVMIEESAMAAGTVVIERRAELRTIFTAVEPAPIDVDFDLAIGAPVPEAVVLEPVPADIVDVEPAYLGHEYFVTADGRIIIVQPRTLEVVHIVQ